MYTVSYVIMYTYIHINSYEFICMYVYIITYDTVYIYIYMYELYVHVCTYYVAYRVLPSMYNNDVTNR